MLKEEQDPQQNDAADMVAVSFRTSDRDCGAQLIHNAALQVIKQYEAVPANKHLRDPAARQWMAQYVLNGHAKGNGNAETLPTHTEPTRGR